jgi:hypothetical protein
LVHHSVAGEEGMDARQNKRRHIHFRPPSALSPQVRSGEIDEVVAAAVEHRFHHVE